MKKKILVAAVGAALTFGAMSANAAATLYGRLHVSIDKFDNGGPSAAGNQPDGVNVVSNASRFGVKGSEDVGGGLKGVYQAEFGFNADETAATNQRNTYLGLAGGFGTFFAGRHDTPYRLSTLSLDPFGDTVGDYNGIIGNSNDATAVTGGRNAFDLRVSNALAYISPNWGGVSFIAAYTWDPLEPATGAQANGADLQAVTATSLAGMYSQGPLFVSVAMEQHDIDNGFAANLSREATKVGVGYDFGVAKVGFVWEQMESDTPTLANNRDAMWATVNGKFGNNQWAVAYGKADDSDATGADDGADMTAVGLFHNFSKTFRGYVVYANMSNDTAGAYTLFGSEHGDLVSAVAGQDVTSISFGAILDF